jgi:beta-glucosidase
MTSKKRGFFRSFLPVLVSLTINCHFIQAAYCQAQGGQVPAFRNASLAVEKRVNDLVSRMTLREKVLQMQHTSPAIPRLGIPSYDWWTEALHGIALSGYATVFPQAIAMAATWDSALVFREAEVASTEARAKYSVAQLEGNHSLYFGLTLWSPNINIFRDPRWGRGQETYGEDPFLTATLGTAFVKGLQGDDAKYLRAVATPKHFAVHSGPDMARHGFNANVSLHDLEDTYLPAFRSTIVEGRAASLMCAYNALGGTPACANHFLLGETLRGAWGFEGFVTSDCGAVADIAYGHHFAIDNEHGSALAVRAGTDTTCGDEYVNLVQAVQDGLIQEKEIDAAVKRLFTARMRLGMFDPPEAVPFNKISQDENDSAAHRRLSLVAAHESMVLLKNQDGILPLRPNVRRIAVIGPNADSLVSLEGNYSGMPSQPVLPLDGIRNVFGQRAEVLYAQGSPYVRQVPVQVPRSIFHVGLAGSLPGLKAEYFASPDFSGQPVVSRIDPQIQFDWNAASPVPGLSSNAFSVRWNGTLTPPGPGEYIFTLPPARTWCHPCLNQEHFRIFLDAKLVTEGTLGKELGPAFAPPPVKVRFADTQPHEFRLEYIHQSPIFDAGAILQWVPPVDVLREEAIEIAKQSDVVVAFVGLSPDLEDEEKPFKVEGFSGGDRTDIDLPRVQQALLEAVATTGTPLVVVLMNGSAVAVNWAKEHAAAILEAWYPGEEAGTAIADTLAGINNPAGRLPVTFYASVDQLPSFDDYSMARRTYRYFDGQPLFAFGYGLSYSRFSYDVPTLSSEEIHAGETLAVRSVIHNISEIDGDEVAELYLQYPTHPGSPLRALKGFQRIHVPAGTSSPIAFTLNLRDLSTVTEDGDRMILPGVYTVWVGASQPGAGPGGKATFQITGQQKLPR